MASAAAPSSTQLPEDAEATGGILHWGLPWLLSSATHLAIIIMMALFGGWHSGAADKLGDPNGISLRDVQVGTGAEGGGGGYDDDADSGSAMEGAVNSAELTTDSARAQTESLAKVPLHDEGALAALLNNTPPLDIERPQTGHTPRNTADDASVPSANAMLGGGNPGNGSGAGQGNGGKGTGGRNGSGVPGLAATIAKGAANTGVFGVNGTGHKFVYVFDRSGSMDGHGGAPLAAAKSELIYSLQKLGKTHQFQIIFYNEHPRVFSVTGSDSKLVFGTDQNRKLAERFVSGITADGATHHEEALAIALQLNPDVIFFLTDADEPTLSPQQLARLARLNNGTSINAIEFGYGPQPESENFLVRLARQNGGQHVYVDVAKLPRL